MNWDRLLQKVKKKAREGDETCIKFLELFEGLPYQTKEKAMKCAININVYYGQHGSITEEKILEIGEKWGVKELLEDEIFALQLRKFTGMGQQNDRGEAA